MDVESIARKYGGARQTNQPLNSGVDSIAAKYGGMKSGGGSLPMQPEKPGFFNRVWNDYKQAGEDVMSGIEEGAAQMGQGQFLRGAKTAALRTAGGVAGAAFAPIFEAPGVHQAVDAVGGVISTIPGVEKVGEFAAAHPEIAKDVKNIVDIATLGGGKAVEKPLVEGAEKSVGSALYNTGKNIVEGADKAVEESQSKFLRDLVRPIREGKVLEEEAKRTIEKPLVSIGKKEFGSYKEVLPTPMEKAAQEVVSKIPGVSEKNTLQGNWNIMQDANIKKAIDLEKELAKPENNFFISHNKVRSILEDAKNSIAENRTLTGNAPATAQKLVDDFMGFMAKEEQSGLGVLKARKKFDKFITAQKRESKVFNPEFESAFSVANKTIRDTAHDILEKGAPNAEVAKSLFEQRALYHAMDNVLPKAAREAESSLSRVWQKIGSAVGERNHAVQVLAAVTGLGGLGAAAVFAPALAAGGIGSFLAYKGGKILLSPQVKKAVGNALKEAGSRLNPSDMRYIIDQLTPLGMTEEEVKAAAKRLRDYAPQGPMKLLPAPKKESVAPKIYRGSTNLSDYYPPSSELPVIKFGNPGKSKFKKSNPSLKSIQY